MDHLVSVDWLKDNLGTPGLVVVDASVGDAAGAPEGIPGAVRFDIDGAFSLHDSGVHTMLPPDQFEAELRKLGLRNGDRVVAYDTQGIFSSARAWWMLRSAGIEAAVLDGGLPTWKAAGYPLGEVGRPSGEGDVTVDWDSSRFIDADTVASRIGAGELVLDARSRERFEGTAPEPRPGMKCGHIPGSKSLPFTDLQRDGKMLPVEELEPIIASFVEDRTQPITTTCGSGVTACIIALAAILTGHHNIAVYDGSWSEWGAADSNRPVATGQ